MRNMWQAHLTILPFLTCMDVDDNNELHPSVAPVNHNFLNEAKTDNWQPMGLSGRTINGYLLWWFRPDITNMFRLCCCRLRPLCIYVEGVDMNEWRNLHLQPFWNTMQNEMLSDLQTYTSAKFRECSYFPRMDLIPMHSLHSCDTKRCIQPCLT